MQQHQQRNPDKNQPGLQQDKNQEKKDEGMLEE